MNKIKSKFKYVYYYIVNSIGFYPTLISLFFAVLALVMLYLETLGLSKSLQNNLPFMIIGNSDTARLILSSITTGVISLTVFSFTMVMLVLNQAGSNFTPRVIPGLISYKSNQRVMGLYLGTLIYTLIIMVNVHSDYYGIPLPGFAIFLAMCFTIVCLGFFVYFIHSISLSIQIESILESIYKVTLKKLEAEIDHNQTKISREVINRDDWGIITSPKTGYLQGMDEENVIRICVKYDVTLCFVQPLGAFLVEGIPFARLNKDLPCVSDFTDELFVHLHFYIEERPDKNYLFGFKHITESATRALSPGLNDPGTAIKAIDYLTDLFITRMKLTDEKVIKDKDGVVRIVFLNETFENLISLSLIPLRLYGKDCNLVVLRLMQMFRNLLYKANKHPHLKHIIYKEIRLLIEDVNVALVNSGDRAMFNLKVQEINNMNTLVNNLPLINTRLKDHN